MLAATTGAAGRTFGDLVSRVVVLLACLTLAAPGALAAGVAPGQDDVVSALEHQHRVRRDGSAVLGGWALVNLTAGAIGASTAVDPSVRAFHTGNALWNTVNLALAVPGLLVPPRTADPGEALRRGRTLEKVYLFNAGLDAAYITAGALLVQRGNLLDQPRLRGWGWALVVQGAFLALYDVGKYAAVDRADRRLELHVGPGSLAIRF